MCDFLLPNGLILKERDYADVNGEGGWRNFPHKNEVEGILMYGRLINADSVKIPKKMILGYALHWIGAMTPDMNNPHIAREIMIVTKRGLMATKQLVYIFRFNILTKSWDRDYVDDLIRPENSHLVGYDLSQHGM
jgi:hypothetical protein